MAIVWNMQVRAPDDVLVQEIRGESVLLDLSCGRYYGLDDMATRFWHVVTTAPSLQEARKTLAAEYDVDGEKLDRDLEELVEKLLENGLLRQATNSA